MLIIKFSLNFEKNKEVILKRILRHHFSRIYHRIKKITIFQALIST